MVTKHVPERPSAPRPEGRRPCSVVLFGPPAAISEGRSLAIPDRLFAVLAYLALRPGRAAKRQSLAAVLFGPADPVRAGVNLRQVLTRLRRLQEEEGVRLAEWDAEVVRLAGDAGEVDLVAFAEADGPALLRRADPEEAAHWLALYRGDLLEGLRFAEPSLEDWLAGQREAASARFAAVAGAVLAREDVAGDTVLDLARRLRAVEPDSGAACLATMRVHLARGHLGAARRAYETHAALLRRDLGCDPEDLLQAFARDHFLAGPRPGGGAPAASAGAVPEAVPPDGAPRPVRTGGPRILILPPLTVVPNKAMRRLANAFIEDVTVGLSRYRSFTVLAYHTARAVAEDAAEAGRLAARGGADFVITSALKPTGDGAAMTFRLNEFEREEVLSVSEVDWHEDRLPKVFAHLVGQVVQSLVTAIEARVSVAAAISTDARAYRLYLEGRHSLTSIDLPNLRRAKRWFRDAAGQMPTYAAPLFGLARATIMEWFIVGMPDGSSLAEALALAERGLALDPLDWRGQREKALACLWLRRHDECIDLFERALVHGPNDADLIADYADALAHCGEPERGLARFERAFELNPLHPDYYTWIKGSILFQTGHYEAALETMEPLRGNPATSRLLAACAALAGRAEEASGYAQTLREVYPGFRADDLWRISPNRRREDTEHFIGGLRLAGVA